MLRLQRVTFLALNEFLGLGHELINQVSFGIFSPWYNVTLVCTFILEHFPYSSHSLSTIYNLFYDYRSQLFEVSSVCVS